MILCYDIYILVNRRTGGETDTELRVEEVDWCFNRWVVLFPYRLEEQVIAADGSASVAGTHYVYRW